MDTKPGQEWYDDAKDYSSVGLDDIIQRFGYHKPSPNLAQAHQMVRQLFIDVARKLDAGLPAGRAKSVALTQLEEACMWSNKALAELAPVVNE